MLAALSPLRDRSNDAALSPVGNGTPKTKSRLGGGVTPTPKPKAKASAMRASSKNPFRDSVRRTSTPINAKEKKKLAAAAGKPMVFDEAVLASPGGGKLTKIQHENDNLRDLNKKLIDKLRAARMSTKDAKPRRRAPRMASNSSASARRTPRSAR
jgi:hypothetical protein